MLKNQGKKVFLIATADQEKKNTIESWIKNRFSDSIVYLSSDHPECLQKIKNAPPTVFISDYILPKAKAGLIVDLLISDFEYKLLPLIILSPLPEKENYLDEIVTGKVQFLEKLEEAEFDRCMNKALNYANQSTSTDFRIRFLSPGDLLMKKGDPAEQVYIVKKGKLKAFHAHVGGDVILGEIQAGEFVGEMGYFNGEARSCDVAAITECELIEVPLGTFEKVLYLRPAWSKKLMETLSKRLKKVVERV